MTGIVNSTGARSGVIGTITGVGATIKHTYIQLSSAGSSVNFDITTSWQKLNLNGDLEITGFSATESNILLCTVSNINNMVTSDGTYYTSIGISTDGTTATASTMLGNHNFFTNNSNPLNIPMSFSWAYVVPASFTSKTLSVITRKQTGAPANTWRWQATPDGDDPTNKHGTPLFSVLELQA